MGYHHIHRYRIAFVDCDPAQIVHFSNYFRWFDTASREFFTACGVPSWRDTERGSGLIGTPLVDAQASFRNPATYGEDIEIESWVDRWSGKSFVMRHVARRGDTVLAEGREVRVFAVRDSVDPPVIRAVAVPAGIRAMCGD
ncbi:4-hydroxybenzoyl-CoA thioesterase [Zoogloea oryzae]|uniref:4-hydroxybenzoyl-CoA thioesterase n=1 Tax=Zoogloea oryzae TaxID=310767 RepID=A0ABQ6FDJ9_9RHOO|nr:acyl-CoA thioesterase [Zoogloea oryzae]GLT23695.1 4-hydroxybenzoyl-CoA thioesterase [Zoogloea oryzae]